jgi:gas vesicle protein
MVKDLIKSTFVFAAGVAAGAAVVLLLAPESGKEAREHLKDLAKDVKERAQEFCEQVKDKVESVTQEKEA